MEYIVYRKEVCKILNEENGIYLLEPINDSSLKYKVMKNSPVLRECISREELDKIIDMMPSIGVITDNKLMETSYKELLKSGTYTDLIKVIKTTYERNEERSKANKKLSDKDKEYFKLAESYLYNEFSVVLGLSYEDTKKYVENKIQESHK